MEEKDIITLLETLKGSKDGNEVPVSKKIEIINWWVKNKAPAMAATFQGDPREFWLKDVEISTARNPMLLNYSIIKIMESMGVIPQSTKQIKNMFGHYIII